LQARWGETFKISSKGKQPWPSREQQESLKIWRGEGVTNRESTARQISALWGRRCQEFTQLYFGSAKSSHPIGSETHTGERPGETHLGKDEEGEEELLKPLLNRQKNHFRGSSERVKKEERHNNPGGKKKGAHARL